ncbi:MAG: hypothetical protein M3O20_16400 [Acidobacteriota bacterium]|nr:hypothetical protein [Acidobacteriota bacterium]
MKKILKNLCGLGFLAAFASFAAAADGTWTGQISDSMCGPSHAKMTSAHAGLTDRDCTLACVKGGGKFVFVSDGKVYKISNQDSPLLQVHAGHTVQLTGDMKGDTVTVSNITMKK